MTTPPVVRTATAGCYGRRVVLESPLRVVPSPREPESRSPSDRCVGVQSNYTIAQEERAGGGWFWFGWRVVTVLAEVKRPAGLPEAGVAAAVEVAPVATADGSAGVSVSGHSLQRRGMSRLIDFPNVSA